MFAIDWLRALQLACWLNSAWNGSDFGIYRNKHTYFLYDDIVYSLISVLDRKTFVFLELVNFLNVLIINKIIIIPIVRLDDTNGLMALIVYILLEGIFIGMSLNWKNLWGCHWTWRGTLFRIFTLSEKNCKYQNSRCKNLLITCRILYPKMIHINR